MTATGKAAIMGALSLYLDFINMFTMLLSLFGKREYANRLPMSD